MEKSYIEMNVSQVLTGFGELPTWEASYILTGPGNGRWILLPEIIGGTATVSFTAGASGTVECTSDSVVDVKNNEAIGEEWVNGEVAVTTQDVFSKCTAIRAVMINPGTMKITVTAK